MSSTTPSTSTTTPSTHRHALTPVEKQRSQLEKLLKDPAKPAYIPPPLKDKTIRPAREMMKNVQGSSAGAGSGEFHVYKASRRREYERLKLLEEETQKEITDAEFERKRREAEEAANVKTAKNRAKRQKKKERAKAKGANGDRDGLNVRSSEVDDRSQQNIPIKKRRLVSGRELVFRRPGEESESEEDEEQEERTTVQAKPPDSVLSIEEVNVPQASEVQRVIIHEDD
ncbi:hypothetical protein AX17_004619 [Amanita inopinata Kibby_2008]|nr:hypothetical protein AX17_004619 [Amanita inopinata Kibby_2008]